MNAKKAISLVLAALMCAGMAACGSTPAPSESGSTVSGSGSEGGSAPAVDDTERVIHYLTVWDEDQNAGAVLTGLTAEYQAAHPGVSIETEKITQNDLAQKIMVLASSNSLPDIFDLDKSDTLAQLIKAGKVKKAADVLAEAGVSDCISDATAAGVANLRNTPDGMWVLPEENNIEGIWYNKKIFADNGIEVPATWTEFEAACDKLQQAGVQPIALFAKGKWIITRWIANMTFRQLGVDSIVQVNEGTLSMTDPVIVEAAQRMQDMNTKGWFGPGVNSVDEDIAYQMMLNGEAAMCYTGSWFTEYLEGDDNNVGEDIALMSFPTFEGGKGSGNDWLSHYGLTLAFSADGWDDAMKDWAAYVFPKYGDYALENLGLLTAYTMQEEHEITHYNQMLLDTMETVTGAPLWMEYKLSQKAAAALEDNAQSLLTGELTAEQYCQICDEAIKAGLAE